MIDEELKIGDKVKIISNIMSMFDADEDLRESVSETIGIADDMENETYEGISAEIKSFAFTGGRYPNGTKIARMRLICTETRDLIPWVWCGAFLELDNGFWTGELV